VKLTELITPQFIQNLQTILRLGLKPDSFNAETALARSLPNAERKGGNDTLVDVLIHAESVSKGIEAKGTGSIKLYKRPKNDCFQYDNYWVHIPKSTMVITRRPNISCYSDTSPREGLQHSVDRLVEFYNHSCKKEGCDVIYSLLTQHNWDPKLDFTVFNFSISEFSIPEMVSAVKKKKTWEGLDSNGDVCLLHNSFSEGSQNFSKRYHVYEDNMTVIIKHPPTQITVNSWDSLDDVTVLPGV
jgi:hypothetical protein